MVSEANLAVRYKLASAITNNKIMIANDLILLLLSARPDI